MRRGSSNKLEYVGNTYGKLTVIADDAPHIRPSGNAITRVIARCECGSERAYTAFKLRSGRVSSCGCVRASNNRDCTINGQNAPEYNSYKAMIRRCEDPRHDSYKWYGARGIKVCDAWRVSFNTFFSDMGPKPSPQHSLDRVDNNGDYGPGNCRWATQAEQEANKTIPRGASNPFAKTRRRASAETQR